MTTMYADTRTCKNCGQDSEQIILGSTNSFGSPDLDLRSPPMVRDTMDTWIQVCPHCKFCAPNIAKAKVPERPVTDPEYLAAFEDERFPELARRFIARAVLDPADAAEQYLYAAWVCDDWQIEGAATLCRLAAVPYFDRFRPFEGEKGISRGAILVDILRRAGSFERAAQECQSLLDNNPQMHEFVRQVLEFEQKLIAAEDRNVHTLEEVKKANA